MKATARKLGTWAVAAFLAAATLGRGEARYMVVDMGGGASAARWGVEFLGEAPAGGFNTDEYKTDKMVLRRVEAGTFMMGSPEGELGRSTNETLHEVTLTEDYWIGVFEVTQRQWELATGSVSSKWAGATRPVDAASYDDIRGAGVGRNWPSDNSAAEGSFIRALREKTGLTFDLPTEAQWEMACRAGTGTGLNSGKDLTLGTECANMAEVGRYQFNQGDGKGGGGEGTAAAGSYLPNAWGLHDMHGNAGEWCLDGYAEDLGGVAATNPTGNWNSRRVLRGGGWSSPAKECRSASRSWGYVSINSSKAGLRLVCATGGGLKFESLGGARTATERPRLCATTGTDGRGVAVAFEVVSGPAVVEGDALRFTGIGEVTVRATAAASGEQEEWRAEQTVKVSLTPATVKLGNKVHLWDGGPKAVAASTEPPGLAVKVTYDGEEWLPSAAGVYPVVAEVVEEGYEGRAEGTLVIVGQGEYLAVDLSGGPEAETFPVIWMDAPPAGGWTDEWKTSKLAFRLVEPGTFTMGSPAEELGHGWEREGPIFGDDYLTPGGETQRQVSLTNAYWMGVFAVTDEQWRRVTGNRSGWTSQGSDRAIEISHAALRGAGRGAQWPATRSVDEGSFLRTLREKTGLAFDLPTGEQREYACRAGTTTALNSGRNLTATNRCPNLNELLEDELPNSWGLYGMHGEGWEWCLNGGTNGALRGGEGIAVACRSASSALTEKTNAWGSTYSSPFDGVLHLEPFGVRLACATERMTLFEDVGTREWTEKVRLVATTGTDAIGQKPEFVATGVGEVGGGWLSFTGPGVSVVTATLASHGTNVPLKVSQTVTVTRATARVAVADTARVEGPGADGVQVETIPAGLPVAVTYNGSAVVPTVAGTYRVVATVDTELYTGCGEGTLVVVGEGAYLEVDLSGGPDAERYGVRVLDGVPEGGWGEEHKTEKLVLRRVEPGTFNMGSPREELGRWPYYSTFYAEDVHRVTLTDAHWTGMFEVTQGQWERVMGSNPSRYAGAARPVEQVGREDIRGGDVGSKWPVSNGVDADSFLGVLRAKTGLTFDLPTEAQWEYDCRAGTTTALNSGRDLTTTSNCVNMAAAGRYLHNQGDGRGGYGEHTAAGSYLPNVWGLHDMHGNIQEMCLDGWTGSLGNLPATNPVGIKTPTNLWSIRGGSWNSEAGRCRSAARSDAGGAERRDTLGFRLVCAAGSGLTFEPVENPGWTESVVLRASTGVDAAGREVEYAVDSGPGSVSGGVLSFSGPGTVVVRATLAGDGGNAPVSVVQTVAVKRVEAKLDVEGKVQTWDGTPKRVTVTTEPAGLDIRVLYDGGTNAPTMAGPHRVTVEVADERVEGREEFTMMIVEPGEYLVVDLSGGPEAERYPARRLDAIPAGGWSDEHKESKLALRWIPAGTFTMGAPTNELGWTRALVPDEMGVGAYPAPDCEILHPVTLTEGYWIGMFEVTQKQWELVMGNNPSKWPGSRRPVEGVSHGDIRGAVKGEGWPVDHGVDDGSFMGKLRVKTGLAFDLPTEAQWEMACRAGTTNALNSGRELTDTKTCGLLGELGRYKGNQEERAGGGGEHTEVGTFLPNAWGLHDMHGNVREWCLDRGEWDVFLGSGTAYLAIDQANSGAVTNPVGNATGRERAVRGGDWQSWASECRSASRPYGLHSATTNAWTGFRVACGAGEIPEEAWTEGSPVAVPYSWLDGYGEALAAAGGDYEAAAVADWDGDGAVAWEEYVAGTNPENKGDVFKVTGWTWAGGEMVPEYGPKDEEARTYTVEAADEADGTYRPRTELGPADGCRFYRVEVKMKGEVARKNPIK